MRRNTIPARLDARVRKAVAHYWACRKAQKAKQQEAGRVDQGSRGAVTGGAQMDGFIQFLTDLITSAGMPAECVHRKNLLELPGFFRPTKEWDVLVVSNGALIAAIETKSHAGPSFSNNFNNRAEEAMGSALDLWTAYREGAFSSGPQPFLGYLFMIEDCAASQRPVRVREPHFPVFPEFKDASYVKRYELFCRKLVLERHYTAAAFLTSDQESGSKGHFATPASDLSVEQFARSLISHVQGSC